MIKYTPTQYNNILDKLPQEIRDVVLSLDTSNHIWKIGEKHNLQIDKVGSMHDLAMDVMMGIVATKDFVKELQDTLQIGALEASVLARDVDENIFKPIKETMIHLYAGRAPYKPSSSLVQYYEEDDEHPELSKENILREIEDPTDSVVKKETTVVASKPLKASELVSLQASKEIRKEIPNKLTSLPAHELVEYHEELKNEEGKKNKNTSFQVSGVGLEVKKVQEYKLNPLPASLTGTVHSLDILHHKSISYFLIHFVHKKIKSLQKLSMSLAFGSHPKFTLRLKGRGNAKMHGT
jgi:hypothetical protein